MGFPLGKHAEDTLECPERSQWLLPWDKNPRATHRKHSPERFSTVQGSTAQGRHLKQVYGILWGVAWLSTLVRNRILVEKTWRWQQKPGNTLRIPTDQSRRFEHDLSVLTRLLAQISGLILTGQEKFFIIRASYI